MTRKRDDQGIADDASAYEDLPEEPERRASGRRQGIADDSSMFEDILDESTDAVRNLDSDWLYQLHGQVFGPVKPRELLEMLYHGELDADTPISCDDDEFQPLRRFGVFRAHLPKVEKHQKEVAEAEEQERRAARARTIKRIGFIVAAVLVLVGSSVALAWWLRDRAQRQADFEKEVALKKELEGLLASVTIEPPLLPLVEEPVKPDESAKQKKKRRRRRRRTMRVSGGGGKGGTGDLTTQEILSGVAKAFSGFRRCIVAQIQRDSESVPDQIVLVFSIGNDGAPKQIDLGNRHLRRTPMKGCMSSHLGKVRWRRFKGEVKNVEYPISIGR